MKSKPSAILPDMELRMAGNDLNSIKKKPFSGPAYSYLLPDALVKHPYPDGPLNGFKFIQYS